MEIFGNEIKCDPCDVGWITSQVSKLPHKHLITGVIAKYNDVYQTGDGGTLKQKGAARRNANSRLRVYIKSQLESMR